MRLKWLSAGAAIALLAMTGSSLAYVIDSVQTSGSPSVAFLNLGTNGGPEGFVSATPILTPGFDNIVSITFTPGSGTGGAVSGVYGGSVSGVSSSPMTLGTFNASTDTLQNYLTAQPGGSVTITYSTPRTYLDLLWGTVDVASGYNLVTGSGDTINGATINSLAGNPASGSTNTAVQISGLNSYTSIVFEDTTGNPSAFEFLIGAPLGTNQQCAPGVVCTPVPEPTSLALLGGGLTGLGVVGFLSWWRRRDEDNGNALAS